MTTTVGSSLDHAIGAEGLLAVRLRDGEVRLRATDGDTVRVREIHDRDLEELFAVERADGSLALRSVRDSDLLLGRQGRRPSPAVDIEVPHRATVVIEAVSGEIEAVGLLGDQRYRTASGDVTLRAVSGKLAVEAVSGDIDIVSTGNAGLTARTVSGDLALRAAGLSSVRATTTSGDLKLAGRFGGPGPYAIDTVSGDVLLAPAGDVRIEMTTLTGDLRSEIGERSGGGRGSRTLEVGVGGPLITVRSLSGDLRVVRPMPVEATAASGRTEPVAASGSASEPAGVDHLPVTMSPAIAAAYDDARLRILRSLERGEIDVAEAGRRLEALDGGGPASSAAGASDA